MIKYLLILLLAAGCSSTKSGPKLIYPSEIKAMCIKARAEAKACLGYEKPIKQLQVKLVAGEKKFGNQWAFRVPDGRWAVEYFTQRIKGFQEIWIPYDPQTREVSYEPIKHGMGHSLLGVQGHDPRHKHCFERWYDSNVR